MEYISAKEFLKQDEKVQKVFIDWWKENNTILDICHVILNKNNTTAHLLKDIDCGVYKPGEDIYPLLTEGQLRKFIEDKKCGKVDITYDEDGYAIGLTDRTGLYSDLYNHLDKDLFKAYWQVAVDIAKQC